MAFSLTIIGIPKFFRWLSERYPLLNKQFDGSVPPEFGTLHQCCVTSTQSPILFLIFLSSFFLSFFLYKDNLYLDMNGIIHNCARRSDGSAFPQTESETMLKVFLYLDKIVGLIKPKRLLYLALDGCAPRAKMNQQRQRRFRSKKEQEEALNLVSSVNFLHRCLIFCPFIDAHQHVSLHRTCC